MKKVITILSLILLLISCNKEESSTPVIIASTEAKINSYSKNYGYSGEIISIFGENFTDKTSDITLKFDEILATIISASTTEIKCVLPVTEKVIPVLNLKIINRYVNNLVVNIYNKNIGILPKIIFNSWITVENPLNVDRFINRVQMTNSKSVYYTMSDNATGNVVYRTLDDGVSWKYWSFCGFASSPFTATINDNGWAYTTFGINKVPIGGSNMSVHIWEQPKAIVGLSVNENLNIGTFVTQNGEVYETNDGAIFNKVYAADIFSATTPPIQIAGIYECSQINPAHIWVGGQKETSTLINGIRVTNRKPYLLYKNDNTGWKERIFFNEPNSQVNKLYFIDQNNGFLMIDIIGATLPEWQTKILKTANGGDTWTAVYNNEKFTNFTFKDENIGWAILENKIYKTTNGGTSWQIDFTHNQNLRNISYKDNVVWVFSVDKILKYYIQ